MSSQTGAVDDEARIRAVLQDRSAAVQAKDARRFTAHYASELVSFELAPPLQFSAPEAIDPTELEAWYATWQGPIDHNITRLKVYVGDGIAFCHSLNRLRGTRTDGHQVDVWTRSTVGLRKLDGTWKVVHEHTSVPFYMDGSGKAALDLIP